MCVTAGASSRVLDMAAGWSFATEKSSVTAVHKVSFLCNSNNCVRRSLSSSFLRASDRASEPERDTSSARACHREWRSLGVDQSELCLALTLPTGQSFRWKLTGDSEYTGVVDKYLFTLRQTHADVEFRVHDVCNCSSGFPTTPRNEDHEIHDSHSSPVKLRGKTGFSSIQDHARFVDADKSTEPSCIESVETTCLHPRLSKHDLPEVVSSTATLGPFKTVRTTSLCSKLGEDIHSCPMHSNGSCAVWTGCAELALRTYLNLDTSLKEVWAPFVDADARFASLAPYMKGARLLRQCPIECLFQFICSSNNHIQRISQMVDYLAGLGPYIGNVSGIAFHAFPTLETLAKVTEAELRKAGFGYRAKHIVGAVKELQQKENGGKQWLNSLRGSTLGFIVEELCSLPGVGPKVAACIALFSLDQHHAIPVDTHVWQIATRYIVPELSGERLTSKLHAAVAEAFVMKFGKYAGWAQNVLFVSELSSSQSYLPEHLQTCRKEKTKNRNKKRQKVLEG